MMCDTCENKEVCKHREIVETTINYIDTIPITAPLDIKIECKLRRRENAQR